MDMVKGAEIAEVTLADWGQPARGRHARYVVDDFGTGARFSVAVGDLRLSSHPGSSVSITADIHEAGYRSRRCSHDGHTTESCYGSDRGHRSF